jgi:hypothetical protein
MMLKNWNTLLEFVRLPTLVLMVCCCGFQTYSQGSTEYGSGLKLALNEQGDKYVRFLVWNQIWYRHSQNNPGSLINGEEKRNTWDISARRLRFMMYAQVSPRYLIVTHFGINNQTFGSGGGSGTADTGPYGSGKKPQLFFHDAWNEYAIVPAIDMETGEENKYNMYLGGGLHYWWGISRMTSASTLNTLTIDAPLVNWPLVELSDQFVRQFGIYTKGQLGKVNYTLAVNKPFATNRTPEFDASRNERVAVDNNGDPAPALTGYADYHFFEQEANALPYRVGTYVGTKKVLNVGAGFYRQNNGTRSIDAAGTVERHDITLLGVDVFADIPVGLSEKNMALTAQAVFYHYNFGPNYIRTIGLMNTSSQFSAAIAPVDRTLNGPGISRMFVGSGNIVHTQAGLLLPKAKHNKMRVQPFAAYTWKRLDYLDEHGSYVDIGTNFFLDGHHAKITPQFSTRPLYYLQGNKRLIERLKGEFLLQLQIFL